MGAASLGAVCSSGGQGSQGRSRLDQQAETKPSSSLKTKLGSAVSKSSKTRGGESASGAGKGRAIKSVGVVAATGKKVVATATSGAQQVRAETAHTPNWSAGTFGCSSGDVFDARQPGGDYRLDLTRPSDRQVEGGTRGQGRKGEEGDGDHAHTL